MTLTFHTFFLIDITSSIQRQTYILDVRVRCTTSETLYSVKIFVARATQLLGRLIVGVPASCSARTFLLSRQSPLPCVFQYSRFA